MAETYRAYVTIMGEREDTSLEFLDLCMMLETGDFDEAERFYDSVYVQPYGVLAHTLHANHPEFVRLEADYDIERLVDGKFVDTVDMYYIDTIWMED